MVCHLETEQNDVNSKRQRCSLFNGAGEPPRWNGKAELEHDLHAHIAVYSLGISQAFIPVIYKGRNTTRLGCPAIKVQKSLSVAVAAAECSLLNPQTSPPVKDSALCNLGKIRKNRLFPLPQLFLAPLRC